MSMKKPPPSPHRPPPARGTRLRPTNMRKSALPELQPGAKMDMALLKVKLAALPPGIPHSLFIGLTGRCNLSCRHCKYSTAPEREKNADMPLRQVYSLITQAAALGIPRVIFFGGEPLLYKGLEKAAAKAAALGLFTELDTNGQLLTRGRAARLAAAGLSSVMVSLHSHAPSRHDALSGAGSFRLAQKAVAVSRAAGLITYISSCVFSGALPSGDLDRLIAFAKRSGAHGARILAYSPKKGASSLPSELSAALRKAGAGNYAGTCARPGRACCAAAGGEILFVGPSGEVRSCPYAAKPLGKAGSLAGFLRRPGRAGRFPCQKPR